MLRVDATLLHLSSLRLDEFKVVDLHVHLNAVHFDVTASNHHQTSGKRASFVDTLFGEMLNDGAGVNVRMLTLIPFHFSLVAIAFHARGSNANLPQRPQDGLNAGVACWQPLGRGPFMRKDRQDRRKRWPFVESAVDLSGKPCK